MTRKQTEEAKFEAFSVMCEKVNELEKENAELKEGLALGSTWNKGLNSMNKSLEEERDKFRNMVFDKAEQLTEAKKIINNCVHELQIILLHKIRNKERIASILDKAEQFLEGE